MVETPISFQDSGYFSKLIVDYLDQNSALKPFYNRFPKLENFEAQIQEKSINYPFENRKILVESLLEQYKNTELSEISLLHIKSLEDENTFTITTGHQLNLFSGPLYFIYKIVATINVCKALKTQFPDKNFVPIYWMATEDHDFEEINFFQYKDKKIQWNVPHSGPVGRKATNGLEQVYEQFEKELGKGEAAIYLKKMLKKSYLEHQNLAEATRFFANELFKNEGLVILDGDAKKLKELFIPYLKKELLEQKSFLNIQETISELSTYKIQVQPREINLFYIEDTLRERIIFEKNNYVVQNTNIRFNEDSLLKEIENYPEKFSPNVVLRPLYQEVLLPNLTYIGGGGEIAYWLELKSNFDYFDVCFPMLLVRNSALILNEKQVKKATKLGITTEDLFLKQTQFIQKKTKDISKMQLDFTPQKEHLKAQFEALYLVAKQTDPSFEKAVKAQEKKQIKGLEALEKRLLKAEKQQHKEQLDRMIALQNELFFHDSLQERKLNFSSFYEEYGVKFLEHVSKSLQPFATHFTLITL